MVKDSIIRFITESGSEYTINRSEKTWSRPSNPNSPFVRTTSGRYREISEIVVGEGVTLLCPPLDFGNVRIIQTTPVVSVEIVER